jgi:hypothetical protein
LVAWVVSILIAFWFGVGMTIVLLNLARASASDEDELATIR